MNTALTIAGSDSSGGAGIQADIKTMTALGVYAMSAITALTAQNTLGVDAVEEVSPNFLGKQLDSIFTDIPPDSVKIGMVSSTKLIEKISEKLRQYGAKKIVVDPVMIATSGARLIDDDAVYTLEKLLFPLAEVITPNIPETEKLSGIKIFSEDDQVAAAKKIYETYKCAVLCKGGHRVNDANDILFDAEGLKIFPGKKIDTPNTHGTGCTLSSAIAAGLAQGMSLKNSISRAKKYLSDALAFGLNLGKGCGPMNHAIYSAQYPALT